MAIDRQGGRTVRRARPMTGGLFVSTIDKKEKMHRGMKFVAAAGETILKTVGRMKSRQCAYRKIGNAARDNFDRRACGEVRYKI